MAGWPFPDLALILLTTAVPPSTPTCSVNGDAYPGNDITLMCLSSHAVPAPTYTWSRDNAAIQLPLQNMIEGSESSAMQGYHTPEISPRGALPRLGALEPSCKMETKNLKLKTKLTASAAAQIH